jgi:hypothetical protein
LDVAADEVGLVRVVVRGGDADADAFSVVYRLPDAVVLSDGARDRVQRGGEFSAGTADRGAGVVAGDARLGAATDLGKIAGGVGSFFSSHGDPGDGVGHGAAMDFVADTVPFLFGGRLFLHPGDWVLLFAADAERFGFMAVDALLRAVAALCGNAGVSMGNRAQKYSDGVLCDSIGIRTSGRGIVIREFAAAKVCLATGMTEIER